MYPCFKCKASFETSAERDLCLQGHVIQLNVNGQLVYKSNDGLWSCSEVNCDYQCKLPRDFYAHCEDHRQKSVNFQSSENGRDNSLTCDECVPTPPSILPDSVLDSSSLQSLNWSSSDFDSSSQPECFSPITEKDCAESIERILPSSIVPDEESNPALPHNVTTHIAYLAYLDIMVCLACEVGFSSARAALSHVKDHHQRLTPGESDRLSNWPELRPRLPPMSHDTRMHVAVPYLRIYDGFQCKECIHCSRTLNSIRNHLSSLQHSGFERNIKIQCLSKQRHYFRVSPNNSCNSIMEDSECVDEEEFLEFRKYLNGFIHRVDAKDQESVSVQSWNSQIPLEERLDERLLLCGDVTKEPWYSPSIMDILFAYFGAIQNTVNRVPWLARRLLTSSDLLCEDIETNLVSRRGFKALQEPESVKRYSAYALELIKYFLRSYHAGKIPCEDKLLINAIEAFSKSKTLTTLHDFLSSVVRQEFDFSQQQASLLIFRFMVTSNCDESGRIMRAALITPRLSMLVYLFRGIVLLDFYRFAKVKKLEDAIYYLNEKHYSPFTIVMQERGLLYCIASDERLTARVQWLDTVWFALTIDGVQVSLDDLKNATRNLLKACESSLAYLLLGCDIAISPLQEYTDNLSNSKLGASFIDSHSDYFTSIALQFWKHARSDIEHRLFFETTWHKSNCTAWLERLDDFTHDLLALVHLTGGMPARGTELAAYTWKNTENMSRTVGIYGPYVILAQRYHKNFYSKGTSNVARFLPSKVGMFIILMLAVLRPFASFIRKQLYEDNDTDTDTEYVWVSGAKVMDSTACRNAFVKAFEKASGKTLNFSSYRQAVQAFAEKHIQLLNNSCMDAVHNQFGHSARTGSIHYGRSQYDIHGMSRDKVSEYMQLSVAWHEVLGIGSPSLSKMSDNAKLPTTPSISALSGSQVIVKLNQTNLVMPSATVSWEAKGYPITQSASSLDLTSTLIKAIQIMTTFGCSGFKSPEQGRLIAEVMKKDADILGILPTGGGKSMAVFAPVKSDMSVCPELSTILIVPLIGLRDQFIHRAEAYNIPCVLWTPSSQIQPCSAPALIIVAVENAVTACFNNFLRDLVNLSKVARVVIDECHLVSTSSSFRPVFEQLHTVRVGSFPLVLLSATIPPLVEKELSLKFASQFRVIRSSTVNWSRYYTVLLFKKEELFSFLTSSILAKRLSSGSSSLVFVKSLREGERLTNSLTQVGHKAAFYSSQLSSEERLSLVSKLGKQIKVLVATSAFGVGIDSPAFDTVVHYNCAWSLLDYIQECGRSGRNPNMSFCYLLKTSELTSGCGDQAMSQYITNTSRCRRSIISEHIDGESVYCVQNLKGVLCDICETELPATTADAGASKRKKVRFETDPVKDIKQISQDQMSIKTVRKLTARESLVRLRDQATEKSFRTAVPPKAQLISALMIQDRVKQDIGDLDGTIKLLRTVKDAGCIVCLFNGVQGQYHQLGQCNYMNGYCVRCFGVTHSDERKCVRPLLKKLCFVCAMPSNLGELWRHDKNYGPNCQQGLSDVLIPLAFIVWRTDQRRQMALDELGTRIKFVNLENYQEYWNWLNERSDLNLPNFVRLLKFCVQQKWI